MNKVEQRVLDKNERINSFQEVSLGYNKDEAIKEASRCLNCKNPRCVGACPVGINIPAFINAIKNDNVDEAYKIILEENYLPGVCGRVCPQENQCEGACIKGIKGDAISIGTLERYAFDNNNYHIKKDIIKNGKKVAIIGSGPSGLTCAGNLISLGYEVTIYESLHEAGGVLTYGIPAFRLPKSIIKSEVERLEKMGVKIVLNALIGVTKTLDELKNEFDYIYIATGAGLPKFMGLKGENSNGVFSANEILTRINLMSKNTPVIENKKVFVIGGGNVALDAARSLKRLNNKVEIIYRRTIEKMPARNLEIKHLLEEGIKVNEKILPIEFINDDDNNLRKIKVINLDDELNEIPGSEHYLECDAVVMALGTNINQVVLKDSNINTTNDGIIIVNEIFQTNDEKIYAGGDATSGSATVIKACEAGKKAAEYIANLN